MRIWIGCRDSGQGIIHPLCPLGWVFNLVSILIKLESVSCGGAMFLLIASFSSCFCRCFGIHFELAHGEQRQRVQAAHAAAQIAHGVGEDLDGWQIMHL
jgi:hypothetical protein